MKEVTIDWRYLIALPQMRTSFPIERLRELANNIAVQGIINPQIIAVFSENQFMNYVNYVCRVWKRSLSKKEIAGLKQRAVKKKYAVIIAGERRLRAMELLWNEGCDVCKEQNKGKKVTQGKCLLKHWKSPNITVRVPQSSDYKKLLSLQLSENIHDRPHTHEEAEAIAQYALFMKDENQQLSYSTMAKRMGKSPEMVSRALSFYELPDSIRNFVREDIIKYGHAIELARLKHKANYSETDLIREVVILTSQRNYAVVENFRKYVNGQLIAYEQKKNQQSSKLEMFFEVAAPEARIRTALDPQTVIAARTMNAFLTKSVKLWEHPEAAPFIDGRKLTVGGLLTDCEKVINTLQLIIPYVEDAVSIQEAKQIREGIRKLAVIVNRKKKFHKKK